MKSIASYLEEDYGKWRNKPYIYTKEEGEFKPRTFGETIDDIRNLAKAMLKEGYENQNIAIYSENSYHWMTLDLAIMGYVGVCIPIDKEWTDYDMNHILKMIDIKAVFYSAAKENVISEVRSSYIRTRFICIEDAYEDMIKCGKMAEAELTGRDNMDEPVQVLFSSGTTDIPKMIPLTQNNIFANWDTLYLRTPMTEKDRSYLFLPLNHVYSGIANFLYTIISGMQIYLCSDMSKLLNELLEVKPTVVCMVPLILKRIYENISEPVLECLTAVRFLYCGGSFTEPEIKHYFTKHGVALLEAYGTTETSSVIALDRLGDTNKLSNGVVLENLDVKILDPDGEGFGEVLVKGESRTKGYLMVADNSRYFDSRGYFHTGDLGRLDESGHLYLKGRKERTIVTSNGKNIYADEIEHLILENIEIKKVKVYLEESCIAAALVTDMEVNRVRKYIEEINDKLPRYKRIKTLHIMKDRIGSRYK